MEMNYCRRCGAKLTKTADHIYDCPNGHTIYLNANPAAGLWIVNDNNEVLVAVRGHEPGRGKLDSPGGFNDGAETSEESIAREMQEEIGLTPQDYTKPEFLLSGIDYYPFADEVLTILSSVYWARLIGNPSITALDDVAEAHFIPINAVNPDDIFFDAPRAGFIALRDSGLYNK
jgi:ADP-ribose pyrophosphatase YjhB (NUDIX family)